MLFAITNRKNPSEHHRRDDSSSSFIMRRASDHLFDHFSHPIFSIQSDSFLEKISWIDIEEDEKEIRIRVEKNLLQITDIMSIDWIKIYTLGKETEIALQK